MKILITILIAGIFLFGCQQGEVPPALPDDAEELGETVPIPEENGGLTEEEPRACCLAMIASCLACSEGVTVEEFCLENPETVGCEETEPIQEALLSIKVVTNPDGEMDLIFLREIFQAFIAYYVDKDLATMELVYYPDSDDGILATKGLLCAKEQGQELEYLKHVVAGKDITLKMYQSAEELLEYDAFTDCLASDEISLQVDEAISTAEFLDVTETPTTFIGNHKVVGFNAFKKYQTIIDEELS